MRFAKMLVIAGLAMSPVVGCDTSNDGSSMNRTQDQTVSPDGRTATQTRSQTRKDGSGQVVQETETRTREVVEPAPGAQPNATK